MIRFLLGLSLGVAIGCRFPEWGVAIRSTPLLAWLVMWLGGGLAVAVLHYLIRAPRAEGE